MRCLLLLVCLVAPIAAARAESFVEGFEDDPGDAWELRSHEPGRAAFDDGRLVLDLTAAEKGKWAWALLHRSIALPATVRWRQQLAHDSPHTYLCGLAVMRRSGQWSGINVGLGGGGLDDCVVLGSQRAAEGQVRQGRWYRMTLTLSSSEQILVVTAEGADEPLATAREHRALTRGPYFLRFFQNDHRLGRDMPDEYEQDRGATWIDDLQVEAQEIQVASPPPPGTSNPLAIPVVYNRATRWLTSEDGLSGGCIAWEAVGEMLLTGESGVSRWLRLRRWVLSKVPHWPDQPTIRHVDGRTTDFLLPEGETEATFALRALQWNLDQHPRLRWSAQPRGVSWSMAVSATDGVHPFVWRLAETEEAHAPSEGELDLREIYRASGRPNARAEMDFVITIRATDNAGRRPGLALRLIMPGANAVLPRTPVVVPVDAARQGVPLEAVVVGSDGALMADGQVQATVDGRPVDLQLVDESGLRGAELVALPVGGHEIPLRATNADGETLATGSATVTVTDLDFLSHYERAKRSYCTPDGEAAGPLLGDLFAWVLYEDIAGPDRRMILGLDDYRRCARAGADVTQTKWRVMPRAAIERYVEHLAESGVEVIRITPNVQVREYYLDAGGHLAMHGLEQLSDILDAGRRHGIRAVINLFHYPYNQFGPPVNAYFEAGYPDEMGWRSDEMWALLSQYLHELLGFIGSDPAVMAYTVMGENDQVLPVEWLNRAHDFIKQRAPRQMVVLEQGGDIFNCREGHPASYAEFAPATDGGVGYRAYQTRQYPTDCFMAVCARFYDLAPPSYHGEMACGIKVTPQFQVKLRDAMGLALTLQQTMAISWSAPPLEELRGAFAEAGNLVDWTRFRRAQPPVAMVVDTIDGETARRLVEYEEMLQALAVDCEYIGPEADRNGYLVTLDAREEIPPKAEEALRRAAEAASPLRVSAGNHTTYALSSDRRWMVAYVRNATRYEVMECDIRAVERCRMPDRPRRLRVTLQGFGASCRYRVWDAATAAVVQEGSVREGVELDLGETNIDVLVGVFPQE
ncbi:MAG: hypothetical protein U9R79_02460 [Armatimonadota bacterium]|nr:hypothetical protein [Armatimonadota bacterium]